MQTDTVSDLSAFYQQDILPSKYCTCMIFYLQDILPARYFPISIIIVVIIIIFLLSWWIFHVSIGQSFHHSHPTISIHCILSHNSVFLLSSFIIPMHHFSGLPFFFSYFQVFFYFPISRLRFQVNEENVPLSLWQMSLPMPVLYMMCWYTKLLMHNQYILFCSYFNI